MFQAELGRQILDDDGRLDMNDILRLFASGAAASSATGVGRSARGDRGCRRCRPVQRPWERLPVSARARMREIGGRNPRLLFAFRAAFLLGFFSSISETVSPASVAAGLRSVFAGASERAFGRGAARMSGVFGRFCLFDRGAGLGLGAVATGL